MPASSDSDRLRLRLRRIGLSESAIAAAWPSWWTEQAETSVSARAELRFSLSRKLGLDPHSMLDDDAVPRFVWRDEASFKHLSDQTDLERSAITSFGRSVGSMLLGAVPKPGTLRNASAAELRKLLLDTGIPFVGLVDLLALCWSVGIPVAHLRVFPWPRKMMAAMSVLAAPGAAILIGRDADYPAPIAFYLAHELGHIAMGHLGSDGIIVDLDEPSPSAAIADEQENTADRFALELLTGNPHPKVLPERDRYSARGLAKTALRSSKALAIEPGVLALCFGHSTKDWRVASGALRHIYSDRKPVWVEINRTAWSQLDLGRLSDDSAEYVSTVLGLGEAP